MPQNTMNVVIKNADTEEEIGSALMVQSSAGGWIFPPEAYVFIARSVEQGVRVLVEPLVME